MKKINFSPLPDDIQQKKQAIWSKIEARLEEEKGLPFSQALQLWLNAKMPSRLASMQAKEKLFLRLASLEKKEFIPEETRYFSFRQMGAALVLASLSVMIFFPVSLFVPQAYAFAEDQILVEKGEVLVNGQKVESTQVLQAGDKIQTLAGARAQVYLADDSRIAIDESSELLLQASSLGEGSQSVLRQNSGRVWVQAINLVDTQLQLLVPHAEVLVDYQSSFESVVEKDKVKLRMHRYMARISEPTVLDQDMLLMEGTSLELAPYDWRLTQSIAKEDSFIQENQHLEQNYRDGKVAEYKENVTSEVWISPGHFLYPVKRLREKVQESVLPGPLKDKVLETHARERLKEYHQAVDKGALEEAKTLALDFENTVSKVDSPDRLDDLKALEIQSQKILVLENKEPVLLETKPSVDLNIAMNAVVEEAMKGETDKAKVSWEVYQGSVETYMENIENLDLQDRQEILADFMEAKEKEKLVIQTLALEAEETWQQETIQNLNTLILSVQSLTPDWSVVDENKSVEDGKNMLQVLSSQVHLDEQVQLQVQDFVEWIESPQPVLVVTPETLYNNAETEQEAPQDLEEDSEQEEGEGQENIEDASQEFPEDPRFKSPSQ